MPTLTLRRSLSLFLSLAVVLLIAPLAAAQSKPASSDGHLAEPPALAKFLPAPDGWTRGDIRLNQIDDSGGCNYTVASVVYAKDELRVKITIADTGGHAESLMAVASMIAILPDDYTDTVPPATTIKRMKIDQSPASEIWNAAKMTGEITVLVSSRYVVAIEAQKGDTLETLRAMLTLVDTKALAAVK